MNKINPKLNTFLSLALVLFALSAAVTAQNRYGGSYAAGVELFYQKDYSAAITAFEKAEAENKGNHAAYLWHGLAMYAIGEKYKAHDVWIKMPWDVEAKTVSQFFKGLAEWRDGETSSAKYWFNDTSNYKQTRGYALSQKALQQLLNGAEVPDFDTWPTLVGLPGAKNVAAPTQTSGRQNPERLKTAKRVAEPEDLTPPDVKDQPAAGAKPRGGLWRGTITNQKGGQTITFRVSPDGRTISDITFVGYWRCPNAINPTQSTRNAPPDDVSVSGGAFSSTQNDRPSRLWYQIIGSFGTATTAAGSIRIAYAGTECDTYKLEWTARRSGQ